MQDHACTGCHIQMLVNFIKILWGFIWPCIDFDWWLSEISLYPLYLWCIYIIAPTAVPSPLGSYRDLFLRKQIYRYIVLILMQIYTSEWVLFIIWIYWSSCKQFFSCIYCRQSRHVSCCMTYNGGHPTGKHFLAAAWYWGTVSHP